MRDPGAEFLASVPPYASQWLLERLRRGEPVGGAQVRGHAQWLRSVGRGALAVQLEFGWRQLCRSAREWEDACDTAGRGEEAGTSAGGSDRAEVAEPVGASGPGSGISAEEAAVRLNITRERVGQMLRNGALKGHKVGGSWVVDVASVESMAMVRGRAS